jgi:steroid delta-isomerase-like uncharacterized protein
MNREQMNRLVERHLRAERAGDPIGCVAMYADDVVHDVVGSPTGPLHGPEAARRFYEWLTQTVRTELVDVNQSWYGENFCVIEHQWTGTVSGEFAGIAGNGRRISHRMLHVWEFTDGRISRESVWLDNGAIIAQLSSPEPVEAAGVYLRGAETPISRTVQAAGVAAQRPPAASERADHREEQQR